MGVKCAENWIQQNPIRQPLANVGTEKIRMPSGMQNFMPYIDSACAETPAERKGAKAITHPSWYNRLENIIMKSHN